LLMSAERSLANPRVSPDRQWIAFDATRPGGSADLFMARVGAISPIPEAEWIKVDQSASHPFWSTNQRFLYYLPTDPTVAFRSVVRARHLARTSRLPEGDSFVVHTSQEMIVPTWVLGTAPIATSDQIIFVLGDFRGDVWMMDLEPRLRETVNDR
jgi:Tol biopolymer transport system component